MPRPLHFPLIFSYCISGILLSLLSAACLLPYSGWYSCSFAWASLLPFAVYLCLRLSDTLLSDLSCTLASWCWCVPWHFHHPLIPSHTVILIPPNVVVLAVAVKFSTVASYSTESSLSVTCTLCFIICVRLMQWYFHIARFVSKKKKIRDIPSLEIRA